MTRYNTEEQAGGYEPKIIKRRDDAPEGCSWVTEKPAPEQLKPCPFCKTLPEVFPLQPEIEGSAWTKIECCHSNCSVKPSVAAYDDCASVHRAEAIAAWNKRPELTEALAIIEKQREALEKVLPDVEAIQRNCEHEVESLSAIKQALALTDGEK